MNKRTIRRIKQIIGDILITLVMIACILSYIVNVMSIQYMNQCDKEIKSIKKHMISTDDVDKIVDKEVHNAINEYDNKMKPNRGGSIDRTMPMKVPSIDSSFKAYMPYQAVTSTSSEQYKYRIMATTDSDGFRRIGDYYVVAMGTYYAQRCGQVFHVELDSGRSFNVIIGDIKSDMHTNGTHQYIQHNGNMIEFLVDVSRISDKSRITGDMSYSGMDGNITTISEII